MNLTEFIPRGKANALSNAALAKALGVSESEAREDVLNARLAGELICSGASGYYIPVNVEEAEAYYYPQLKRFQKGAAVLRPVKAYIDEQRRSWSQLNITDTESEAGTDERDDPKRF